MTKQEAILGRQVWFNIQFTFITKIKKKRHRISSIDSGKKCLANSNIHSDKTSQKTRNKKDLSWASLVAQWLRICLPMQGTRVRALVWEDPTCRRATGPHEPQLLSLRVWSLCSATREAAIVRGPCTAMKSGPRLPQLEKALAQKRRPNTAINKLSN